MRKIYLAAISCLLFTGLLTQTSFAQTQTKKFVVEYDWRGNTTTDFTWTVPCGVTSITVEAWGGGGAGGGATRDDRGGGGGAGGAYVLKNVPVTPGTTYSITVGRGGRGDEGNGDSGEDSWFRNTTMVFTIAKGGQGGEENGDGGNGTTTGSIGDIIRKGGDGYDQSSNNYGGAGGGGAGTTENGGNSSSANAGPGGNIGGGDGGAKRSRNGNNNYDGLDGGTYGGGGGGAYSSSRNRDGGNGGDGQVIITYTGVADNYCKPTFNFNVEPITNVTFAGINNTTSRTVNGTPEVEASYCTAGNVSIGASYPISVQGNTDGRYYDYFTVWIDWNQDGSFADNITERTYILNPIYNSSGIDGQTQSATITVPSAALTGTTKMRVVKNYNTSPTTACGIYTYGQAEDYLVNVTGNCATPTSATANGVSGTLTICSGTPVTLKQIGGIAGSGNWQWTSGSCNGTLVGNGDNLDGIITVTPSTTTTYFVHSTCGSGCASVTVVVNTNGTIAYTSGGQNLAICKNVSINPGVVYTTGGGAKSASIVWSPVAPGGVSGIYNAANKTFTISGTPNQAGIFNYTITPGGNSPCTNTSINGSITVSEVPASLNYTNTTITYCSGGPITPNKPTVTGGLPTLYSVSPALPIGLSIDPVTGFISGTPTTETAAANYTVKAENTCGSVTRDLTITISSGDQAFNITPVGTYPICSVGGSVTIGLSNSATNINYQLFKDGIAFGPAVAGSTGNSITFGNQSTAGVYTVKTASSCATNMIGSVTINVTPVPTTTFTYSTYTYCKSGYTPAAILAGSPATGTFSSSPGGLVFADASTGVIDLDASTKGDYTITYTVAAVGGCDIYTYTQATRITIMTTADVYSVIGGGGYCSGSGGVSVGLENSQTSVNYELYRDGTLVGTYPGTGAPLNFGNQTFAGTYTVVAKLGSCSEDMDGEAVVTINPAPANIKITPATATLCQGSIIPLTASLSSESVITYPVTVSSGNIGLSIPNNNASGTFSLLKVAGIPVGATITGVSVNFRISHNDVGDLVINLKGPNGNVLNIANRIGGSGNNFGNGATNTFVNDASINSITTGAVPYISGPYSPQAAGAVAGATSLPGNVSNTGTFSGLYGATAASANGNWILSVRDNANNSSGTLNNCQIVITYTMVNNPTSVTWLPATGLYTDPGATIPYAAGNSAATVYAKPSVSDTIPYTATATNVYGCSTDAGTTLTVNPSPVITITANYCNYPNVVRIIAKSNIKIDNWIWSTGGNPGTSKDTSFIDVNVAGNYFVSAKSAGYSCPGSAVMSIAQELVTNGDFELGNTGFESDYYYQADVAGNNELVDHNANGGTNGYGVGTNGQNYHDNFWGIDHTYGTGDGKFMIVNGHGSLVAWKNENVTVLPNTTYYFSGWGMSLNRVSPYARLKFIIDGDGTYNDNFTANLAAGVENDSNNGWQKFYGKWTSGPTTTSVNISIVNLENSLGGNDFALDDISFGTLSTFFNLTSDISTKSQTGICEGAPVTDITYEAGGDGNPPSVISGNYPPGLDSSWNGRTFRLSGIPTTPGTYNFTLQSSGCNPRTQNVIITVIAASNAGTFTGAPIISACYGTNGTIALTGSVGSLQWQTSPDDTNWSNATNGNYTNLTSAAYYRVIAKNASCPAAISPSVKLGVKNLWIGKTNDNWNTGTNWSDESTPTTACDDVIIPQVSSSRYPMLNSGTTSVKNIIIRANASLIVNGTGIMQIAGTITKDNLGILDAKLGTLEFNGPSTQSLSGSILKDKTIKNLVVSNAAWLNVSSAANDTLNITGTLSFGSASAKLNSGNNITLKSTATGTANVGVVGTGNTITGQFVVERFINSWATPGASQHGKSWQLVATPTNGQSVKDSWMEGGTIVTVPTGYGTQITGTGTGFDLTTPTPSLKYYDPNLNDYIGVKNTGDQVYRANGYMLFVRGDRSVVFPGVGNTTLRTKGKLFTGTTSSISVPANKFASVGNPYASAIDLRKITLTGGITGGVMDQFMIWDPSLGGDYSLGAFRTLVKNGAGDYESTPSGSGNIYNNIESGQAFFVQTTTAAAGTITIKESDKVNGSSIFMRPMGGNYKISQLRTNLYGVNPDGSPFLTDGTLIQYSTDYSNAIDGMDARKMTNTSENLSIKSGGKDLVIERRAPIVETDTIFYNLKGVRVQPYRFEFIANGLEEYGEEGWLEDSYLKTRTPINMEGTTTIDFKIENIAGSYAANRFRIIFKEAAVAGPLPVTFVSVKATQKDDDIAVEWKVENESNLKQYQVEKSLDGNTFSKAGTVVATGAGVYNWLDQQAADGYNYYRIRSVDINGQNSLTQIVKVMIEKVPPSISIYPNPITNGVVNLQLAHQPAGVYGVRLLNPVGQTIFSKKITHAGGSSTEKIPWDYNLAHGMYQLEVTQPDGGVKIIRVMY